MSDNRKKNPLRSSINWIFTRFCGRKLFELIGLLALCEPGSNDDDDAGFFVCDLWECYANLKLSVLLFGLGTDSLLEICVCGELGRKLNVGLWQMTVFFFCLSEGILSKGLSWSFIRIAGCSAGLNVGCCLVLGYILCMLLEGIWFDNF